MVEMIMLGININDFCSTHIGRQNERFINPPKSNPYEEPVSRCHSESIAEES